MDLYDFKTLLHFYSISKFQLIYKKRLNDGMILPVTLEMLIICSMHWVHMHVSVKAENIAINQKTPAENVVMSLSSYSNLYRHLMQSDYNFVLQKLWELFVRS